LRSNLAFLNAAAMADDVVELRTESELQFIDVTTLVEERVRRSGVRSGLANIQSLHTTAAVIVNEDEPRLLADLARTLERLAPRELRYQHDDLHLRRDVPPDERPNGHAHCRALALAPSATLQIREGRLGLGRWQRILFVELDGPRRRALCVLVIGSPDAAS